MGLRQLNFLKVSYPCQIYTTLACKNFEYCPSATPAEFKQLFLVAYMFGTCYQNSYF